MKFIRSRVGIFTDHAHRVSEQNPVVSCAEARRQMGRKLIPVRFASEACKVQASGIPLQSRLGTPSQKARKSLRPPTRLRYTAELGSRKWDQGQPRSTRPGQHRSVGVCSSDHRAVRATCGYACAACRISEEAVTATAWRASHREPALQRVTALTNEACCVCESAYERAYARVCENASANGTACPTTMVGTMIASETASRSARSRVGRGVSFNIGMMIADIENRRGSELTNASSVVWLQGLRTCWL